MSTLHILSDIATTIVLVISATYVIIQQVYIRALRRELSQLYAAVDRATGQK